MYKQIYTENSNYPIMDELLKKYAGMCDAGTIRPGEELPKKFTFNELEYLWANGYIYEDRNTFIVMVTDGFGQ